MNPQGHSTPLQHRIFMGKEITFLEEIMEKRVCLPFETLKEQKKLCFYFIEEYFFYSVCCSSPKHGSRRSKIK
jgi:hypothetical protein